MVGNTHKQKRFTQQLCYECVRSNHSLCSIGSPFERVALLSGTKRREDEVRACQQRLWQPKLYTNNSLTDAFEACTYNFAIEHSNTEAQHRRGKH